MVQRLAFLCVSLIVVASTAATLICFPWNTDPQGDETAKTRNFYQKAYAAAGVPPQQTASGAQPLSAKEQFYVDFARQAASESRISEKLNDFVERFGLKQKKILEVGAGSGLLQDLVPDYTALDISPTARRFFHKPFVEASATDMPFPDNTFDGLWSVWVLEHIPNPEKALLEMRRVVKPGGYIFLYPAFDVSRYAAQGYSVRPYSDFDWKGKLIKATVPLSKSEMWHYLQFHQVAALRFLGAHLNPGPSRLHFISLTPNYDLYWVADSDAAISLSLYELYLWFITRGDRCIDCPSETRMVLRDASLVSLTVQVVKP
jgi:SAM-dependent methyltransferase